MEYDHIMNLRPHYYDFKGMNKKLNIYKNTNTDVHRKDANNY